MDRQARTRFLCIHAKQTHIDHLLIQLMLIFEWCTIKQKLVTRIVRIDVDDDDKSNNKLDIRAHTSEL